MFLLNYQKQIKTRTALRRPVLSLICIMLHRRHRQRHRLFHSLMPWRVLPSLSDRSIAKQQATAFWNYRANLEKMIHPQLQSRSTRRIFACRQVHTINLNSFTVSFFKIIVIIIPTFDSVFISIIRSLVRSFARSLVPCVFKQTSDNWTWFDVPFLVEF